MGITVCCLEPLTHREHRTGAGRPLLLSPFPSTNLTIKSADAPTGTAVGTAWATFKGEQSPKAGMLRWPAMAQQRCNFRQYKTGRCAPLALLQTTNTGLYQQVKAAIASVSVTLPPSGAVAGIYASVDRDRGVWKAPANVSVTSVIRPVLKITDDQQKNLNVDDRLGSRSTPSVPSPVRERWSGARGH